MAATSGHSSLPASLTPPASPALPASPPRGVLSPTTLGSLQSLSVSDDTSSERKAVVGVGIGNYAGFSGRITFGQEEEEELVTLPPETEQAILAAHQRCIDLSEQLRREREALQTKVKEEREAKAQLQALMTRSMPEGQRAISVPRHYIDKSGAHRTRMETWQVREKPPGFASISVDFLRLTLPMALRMHGFPEASVDSAAGLLHTLCDSYADYLLQKRPVTPKLYVVRNTPTNPYYSRGDGRGVKRRRYQ